MTPKQFANLKKAAKASINALVTATNTDTDIEMNTLPSLKLIDNSTNNKICSIVFNDNCFFITPNVDFYVECMIEEKRFDEEKIKEISDTAYKISRPARITDSFIEKIIQRIVTIIYDYNIFNFNFAKKYFAVKSISFNLTLADIDISK